MPLVIKNSKTTSTDNNSKSKRQKKKNNKRSKKMREDGVSSQFANIRYCKLEKWRPPVRICLDSCRYDIIRDICSRYGIVEVPETEDWSINWTDFICQYNLPRKLEQYQLCNHFPGMYNIYRKDMLARNLNRMRRVFGPHYDIFPETWVLPSDFHDLQRFTESHVGRSYICKPESGCQGKGITIVKSFRDINPFWKAICQVYINRPFLIDQLKFDLRLYVFVTCCNPLRFYLHEEGLARFATERYRQPSRANTANAFMHLTNYSLNKKHTNYSNDAEKGSKRRAKAVLEFLRTEGYDIKKLQDDIDDVIIKTLITVAPTLQTEYEFTYSQHHKGLSACFEVLGFDIILDGKLKPFLLEVNHSPSFHTDSEIDLEVKDAVLGDTVRMINTARLMDHFDEYERRRLAYCKYHRLQWALSFGYGDLRGDKAKAFANEEADLTPQEMNSDEVQFKWELESCGGYRLLFPTEHTGYYDKFYEASMRNELSSLSHNHRCALINRLKKLNSAQRKLVPALLNEIELDRITRQRREDRRSRYTVRLTSTYTQTYDQETSTSDANV